eukprot:gene2665-20378_t
MLNNSTHHCDGGCRVSMLLLLLGSAVIVAGQQSGGPVGTLLLPSHARNTAVSTVARIATLKDGGDAAVAHKRQRRGSTRYQTWTCFGNCRTETFQGLFGTSWERTTCDEDCRCNEGFFFHGGGICLPCYSGSYKPNIGNDRSCIPHPNCQPGTYRSGANSKTERATCYRCSQGSYSTASNANACTPCRNCKETQVAIGECAGTADTQCEECDNAVCRENEYRSGSCNSNGAGFTCSACDNFDCTSKGDRSNPGKHMYRAGTCGGQATPTVNGYTCDKHEPCPAIDTFYLPSDDTQRTCSPCPAGQHQPFANHRETAATAARAGRSSWTASNAGNNRASSANANVTGSLRRVQQQHVPYGGAEGQVRWDAMQQSASAPRLINDAGVYLQSSSEQAMLYDTGDVPGIAGDQLPVYAEVDDAQDPDRGAAQVNATMQRCKYRQAGAGGQRCKAKTSAEWCEKHTCSTPACKNSKASKDVVCVRCPERAEAGGVMYAARNDGTLRIGADGGVFYATRNDGNCPSTGANAAGGGIKRSGNRKGSVYLGFEEGGETSTL